MIFTELEVLTFQKCAKRYNFARRDGVWPDEGWLKDPRVQLVNFCFSWELKQSAKPSIAVVKNKWSDLCTNWAVEQRLEFTELRDFIAKEYVNVHTFYNWFTTCRYIPVSPGTKVNLMFGKHGLETYPQYLVTDTKTLYSISTSLNDNVSAVGTNYILKSRLYAVQQQYPNMNVKGLNINFTSYGNELEIKVLDPKTICNWSFRTNMGHALKLMAMNYSLPIFNCKIKCPFKDICFR